MNAFGSQPTKWVDLYRLLGLKGSLNESELDLLRQRSLEARREKAKRGELLIASSVDYRKGELRLEKDPDWRVQERSQLALASRP